MRDNRRGAELPVWRETEKCAEGLSRGSGGSPGDMFLYTGKAAPLVPGGRKRHLYGVAELLPRIVSCVGSDTVAEERESPAGWCVSGDVSVTKKY